MAETKELSSKHILGIKHLNTEDLHLIFKTAKNFKEVIKANKETFRII